MIKTSLKLYNPFINKINMLKNYSKFLILYKRSFSTMTCEKEFTNIACKFLEVILLQSCIHIDLELIAADWRTRKSNIRGY